MQSRWEPQQQEWEMRGSLKLLYTGWGFGISECPGYFLRLECLALWHARESWKPKLQPEICSQGVRYVHHVMKLFMDNKGEQEKL